MNQWHHGGPEDSGLRAPSSAAVPGEAGGGWSAEEPGGLGAGARSRDGRAAPPPAGQGAP